MSARKDVVEHHGKCAAHGRARHEYWSEQSARRSRAKGDNQRNGLGEHHDEQQIESKACIQNVGDCVIADAENAGNEVSDDAQTEAANRRPPELVDGKFLELILDPVKRLAESDRRQATQASE